MENKNQPGEITTNLLADNTIESNTSKNNNSPNRLLDEYFNSSDQNNRLTNSGNQNSGNNERMLQQLKLNGFSVEKPVENLADHKTAREDNLQIMNVLAKLDHNQRQEAPDPTRIKQLITDLNNDSSGVRSYAQAELVRIGRPALPALTEANKTGNAEVQHVTNGIIEKIKTKIYQDIKKDCNDKLSKKDDKVGKALLDAVLSSDPDKLTNCLTEHFYELREFPDKYSEQASKLGYKFEFIPFPESSNGIFKLSAGTGENSATLDIYAYSYYDKTLKDWTPKATLQSGSLFGEVRELNNGSRSLDTIHLLNNMTRLAETEAVQKELSPRRHYRDKDED